MLQVNVHLYPSTIQFESRMMRMTSSLARAGLFDRIDLVGIWEQGLPEIEWIDEMRRIVRLRVPNIPICFGRSGRVLRHLEWNWRICRRYRDEAVRMVNPHIVWALPAAHWLKRHHGSKLVYDTHELETETIGSTGMRRILGRMLEQQLVYSADAVNVVSSGIEHWYRIRYELQNVHTIKNYPMHRVQSAQPNVFRETFGIPEDSIVFCYHGHLSRVEEIELLIAVFRRAAADRHIVFMGFGPLSARLQQLAAKMSNLHFHPAVPFADVPTYTGSADVAIVLFNDACLSYHHVLPNKLLESLSAGVPALVSNLPEMVAEIADHDSGWIINNDADSLVAAVNNLDMRQILVKKAGACAWSRLNCWENEASRMISVYRSILSG